MKIDILYETFVGCFIKHRSSGFIRTIFNSNETNRSSISGITGNKNLSKMSQMQNLLQRKYFFIRVGINILQFCYLFKKIVNFIVNEKIPYN